MATAAIQDMKTKNRHDLPPTRPPVPTVSVKAGQQVLKRHGRALGWGHGRDGFWLGKVLCHTRSGKRRDERNQEKI